MDRSPYNTRSRIASCASCSVSPGTAEAVLLPEFPGALRVFDVAATSPAGHLADSTSASSLSQGREGGVAEIEDTVVAGVNLATPADDDEVAVQKEEEDYKDVPSFVAATPQGMSTQMQVSDYKDVPSFVAASGSRSLTQPEAAEEQEPPLSLASGQSVLAGGARPKQRRAAADEDEQLRGQQSLAAKKAQRIVELEAEVVEKDQRIEEIENLLRAQNDAIKMMRKTLVAPPIDYARTAENEQLAAKNEQLTTKNEQLTERAQAAEARVSRLEEALLDVRREHESFMERVRRVESLGENLEDIKEENRVCRERLEQAAQAKSQADQTIARLQAEVRKLQQNSKTEDKARACATQMEASSRWDQSLMIEIRDATRASAPVLDKIADVLQKLNNTQEELVTEKQSASVHRTPAPKFKGGAGEEVEIFLEMFRRYCALNKITSATRTDVLLSCLSDSVYASLHKAGLTAAPSWKAIVAALKSNYGVVKQPPTWRAEFYAIQRQSGESLTALSQRLQYLAKKSEVNFPQDMLIERFLAAIDKAPWAAWMQTVVRTFSVTTYDAIVRLAIDMEQKYKLYGKKAFTVATCEVDTAENNVAAVDVDVECNSVRSEQDGESTKTLAGHTKEEPTAAARMKTIEAAIEKLTLLVTQCLNKESPKRSKRVLECFNCKSTQHVVRQCPKPCANCGRKGHSASMCKTSKNEDRDTPTPQ